MSWETKTQKHQNHLEGENFVQGGGKMIQNIEFLLIKLRIGMPRAAVQALYAAGPSGLLL